MHRTVKGKCFISRSAEVNGTKKNRCVEVGTFPVDSKRAEQGNSLLGSQFVYICVLSDDFATVDVREELCYHSRPKKRKFKRRNERQKPMKRKHCAAEKAAADPQAVQRGRLRSVAPFGLVFPVVYLFLFRGVCLAAAPEREARRFVVRRQPHHNA